MKQRDQIDDERDLAEALNRWGGDLETWPEIAAAQARNLISNSVSASRLMREAEALETGLAQFSNHRATRGLVQKILTELPARTGHDGLQQAIDWLTGALWRPALVAVFPLLFGFILGTVVPEEDSQLADELSLLVFSSTYEELEDEL